MDHKDAVPPAHFQDDEEGVPSSKEEGEPTMRSNGNLVGSGGEDSSEEEDDDDPEEARHIAEGFIAEDDDKEEEDDESRRERKRRRRKKRKQAEEDFEVDEGDLELLAENTGQPRKKELHRLKRFRRGSASPGAEVDAAAQQRALAELFKDDEDDKDEVRSGRRGGAKYEDDDDLPSVGQAICAAALRKHREVGYKDDGLDDFIEEDEDEEEMRDLDEEEREARRRERREEKRRARMSGSAAEPAKAGIDREAWDEIHEIFGNGEDYYWVLEEDVKDGLELDGKSKMEYKDIFEPAQIAERMLTEEDH